jgi:hypothetical protein
MRQESNALFLSRRTLLAVAAAGFVPWGRLHAAEFWDKKDPSQWTTEEIEKLTTNSPWAKQVTAQFVPGANDGGYGRGSGSPGGSPGGGYPGGSPGGGYPGGGMPRIGIGGIGIGMPRGRGMGRGGPGGGGGRGGMSTYKGTVRWESAQPMLDALKLPLPEALANRFVIGIRDFPLLSGRRRSEEDDSDSSTQSKDPKDNQEMLDRLKQFTTLQPKGKEMAQAGVVCQTNPGSTHILFGFAKDFFDFGKDDHEVDFSTQVGSLMIKAKFDPKEMLYHKKLAV